MGPLFASVESAHHMCTATVVESSTGRTGTITAVIGGPHQGGCDESRSYSPLFAADTDEVLARAVADAPGDDVPAAGSDEC